MPAILITEAVGAVTPDEYRAQLNELLAQIGTITGASETAMIGILDDARAQIQTLMAGLDFDSPTRQLLAQARAGIDTAIANLADRMGKTIGDYQSQGLAAGVDLAVKPVGGERGFDIVTNAVTADQLQVLGSYSADLVQGVTSDLRKRINGEIASVVVGAKSPYAAAKAIGKNLTDVNHFSTMAHRARAIVVTEVGRAQALGTQAGQQALEKSLKAGGFTDTVRKRWINAHLPGARETHLEAEAKYHPDGSMGPITVQALFDVGGFKALYPRDPSLPASESVNCHCISITVLGEGPDPVADATAGGKAKTAYTNARAATAKPADRKTDTARRRPSRPYGTSRANLDSPSPISDPPIPDTPALGQNSG